MKGRAKSEEMRKVAWFKGMEKAWLLLAILLGLLTLGIFNSPLEAQQQEITGLFGTVTSIEFPSSGLAVILLDTPEGSSEVEAVENTGVTIPDRESASASDIVVGDFLAVLAQTVDQKLEAQQILVKPTRPVLSAHLVGVVAEVGLGQFVAVDHEDNRVLVELEPGVDSPAPGQGVTAVLRQDLKTGSLSTSQIELAEDSLERLKEAVEEAQTEENRENLKQRLVENMSSQLSLLQRLSGQAPPEARPGLQRAIDRSIGGFQQVLSNFNLEGPFVTFSGVVTLIDPSEALVTVLPQVGDEVVLFLTGETSITLAGEPGDLNDLSLGHQVEVSYDPLTLEVQTLGVQLGEELGAELVATLLTEVGSGEGVIVNLSRKRGSVVVFTTAEQRLEFAVDESTIIEREGLRVSITGVRLGDLVRAATRFDPPTLVLTRLVLEEPRLAQLEGFIRGKLVVSPEKKMLTLSTPGLGLLTLMVVSDTTLTRGGEASTFEELEVGDRVVVISRPVDLKAIRIEVLPLKVKRLSGTIVAKDEQTFTIAIEPLGGERVSLIISKKTRIRNSGGKAITFVDLTLGTQVALAFYVPETKEVVTIRLAPP